MALSVILLMWANLSASIKLKTYHKLVYKWPTRASQLWFSNSINRMCKVSSMKLDFSILTQKYKERLKEKMPIIFQKLTGYASVVAFVSINLAAKRKLNPRILKWFLVQINIQTEKSWFWISWTPRTKSEHKTKSALCS